MRPIEFIRREVKVFQTIVEEEKYCLINVRASAFGPFDQRLYDLIPLRPWSIISALYFYPIDRMGHRSAEKVIEESKRYVAGLPINKETIGTRTH